MLNMIKGCRISDPSILVEGYERGDTGFFANVDADKIQEVLEHFIALQDDRVFLILEVPTNAKEEPKTESGALASMHMDVYYWDGLPKEYAIDLLRKNGELLIHDGMSRFGFGAHSGNNEIMLDYYNVVIIYTGTPNQYDGFFESHQIPEVKNLQTAWEYFTDNTPGECALYHRNGKTIYDFVEFLKPYGLYFAERREKWQ